MPSTYTLNNGIELIATGEQSGTWGDTTNVNLGLIDTALDGQVTITLPAAGSSGSPNALAISDGSASDGRNRLIIFTDGGDLGATAFVQLTPNDAEKIVYIRNNLTGGRAITLFQGTYNASNDYEVPAGTTAVVFFNGGGAGAVAANVFNNAFFDSLRLGAVSVTAILDEDNMASDSATALATQQSIKAYVDAQVGANNELSEVLANGNTSGGNDIQMTTTDEVQFRDTALTIKSSVDGQLDIAADVELEIVAPTLDINASTAVTIDTTTMTVTGSVNVVGDLDVDNLNINGNSIISTNTDGNITLDPNGTGSVAVTGPATVSGNLTVDTDTLFVDAATNRVGIGVTPAQRFHIKASGTTFVASAMENTNGGTDEKIVDWLNNNTVYSLRLVNDAYNEGRTAYDVTRSGNTPTIHRWYTAASGAPSERMRISDNGLLTNQVGAVFNESGADSDFRVESDTNTHALFVDAGNNAIGVFNSDPSQSLSTAKQLVIGAKAGDNGITINSGTSGVGRLVFSDGTSGTDLYSGYILYDHAANAFNIGTAGSERMKITTGEVVVNEQSQDLNFRVESNDNANMVFVDAGLNAVFFGTATPTSGGFNATTKFVMNATSDYVLGLRTTNSSGTNNEMIDFRDGDDQRMGLITGNASANTVTYGTSSDRVLKKNDRPIPEAANRVKALNPVLFDWISDGSSSEGFIAQELEQDAQLGKDCVSGKDGEKTVDYGKLTPLLTAALQEAIAKIETLEARIAALENA